MKRSHVWMLAIVCICLSTPPSFAEIVTITVDVNGTIYSTGSEWTADALQLDYQWAEDNHRQVLLGFDLSGELSLADIDSINSLELEVHETHTYYTGNNVHVYVADNDDWADGTYAYGAYGSSLGSNCVFRRMPNTHSDSSRTTIPIHREH